MSAERDPLDPQVKALFDMMAPGRETRVLEAKALREGFAAMEPLLAAGAPEVAAQSEVRLSGPASELRALVFHPDAPEPRPVLLLIHGGGWVIMSPETHVKLARQLCVETEATVVSLDYRMAPEYPYPAALDDCVTAVRWIRENAGTLGVDGNRLAIAGDSAGGQLTATTTLGLLAAGDAPPRAAALLCPVTDMALDTESYRRLAGDDPILDDPIMRFFRDAYVRETQWDEPGASPLRADLSDFPPAYVLAGEIDPLHDDGVRFADKLRAAGREVELDVAEGMPHDFFLFPGIDAGPRAISRVAAFLRDRLA